MNSILRSSNPKDTRPIASRAETGNRQTAIRSHKWQAVCGALRRRFDPISIGFLVGGAILGIAGCILGVLVPYRHPVGLTFSILWWGFWLGFIGAYIGACLGELFFGPRAALEDHGSGPFVDGKEN
jgi:hypothetical protein